MGNPVFCLKCSRNVVPRDNGNCPDCGAGLVAPKPGSLPEPEREITHSRLSRTREGKDKAWIRFIGGGIFCGLGVGYTWGTYHAAVANGGGWYVITPVAIVLGGYWMITGLIAVLSDGEME